MTLFKTFLLALLVVVPARRIIKQRVDQSSTAKSVLNLGSGKESSWESPWKVGDLKQRPMKKLARSPQSLEQASPQSTAEEPTEKEAAQPSEPENKDGLDVESSKEEPTPEGSASSSEPKKLDPEMDCEEYTYEELENAYVPFGLSKEWVKKHWDEECVPVGQECVPIDDDFEETTTTTTTEKAHVPALPHVVNILTKIHHKLHIGKKEGQSEGDPCAKWPATWCGVKCTDAGEVEGLDFEWCGEIQFQGRDKSEVAEDEWPSLDDILPELAKLPELKELSLQNLMLKGDVSAFGKPASQFLKLQKLDLMTHGKFPSFSGDIEVFGRVVKSLTDIMLSYGNFHGDIKVFGKLPHLTRVGVDNCPEIQGQIAELQGQTLTHVFLSGTSVEGALADFTKLPHLVSLSISNTKHITGDIADLKSLSSLRFVKVSDSEITGSECDIEDLDWVLDGNEPKLKKCPPDPAIVQIFEGLDVDHNGFIGKEEYGKYMEALGFGEFWNKGSIWEGVCESMMGLWGEEIDEGIPLDVFVLKQYGKDAREWKIGRYGHQQEDLELLKEKGLIFSK